MSEHPVSDPLSNDVDVQHQKNEYPGPIDQDADAISGDDEVDDDDYEDDESDSDGDRVDAGDDGNGNNKEDVENGGNSLTEMLLGDPNDPSDDEDEDEDQDDEDEDEDEDEDKVEAYTDEQGGAATGTKKRPIDDVAEEGSEKDAKKAKA